MTTPIAYIVLDESSPRLIAGQYQFDRLCSGALIIPSGASFPGDPFSGEIFWKTDEAKLFRRDNTNTTWQEAVGGNSDNAAAYVVIGLTSSLSNERALSSSFGITFVDNGGNNTIEININEVEIPVLSASNTFTGPNVFTDGLSGSHTHLDDGSSYLIAGPGIIINSESNGSVVISGSGGDADPEASYVVIGLTASLTNERALSSSFGNKIIDLGANANVEINVDESEIPVLSASNTFSGNNIFTSGLSGTLFENESGLELFVAGDLTLIDSSSTTQITISVDRQSLSGNFADVGASYVVIGNTASLSNERALVSGFGNDVVDEGADGDVKIDIDGSIIPVLSATNLFTGANTFSIISGTLMRNQSGNSYLVAGDLTLVDSSSGDQVIVSVDRQNLSGNFADVGASYIVIGNTASLPNERSLTSSFGNQIVDGGADSTVDVKIDETLIPTLTASNSFSGVNTFTAGLSGSLTKLADGTDYLIAGAGIEIASSTNGPITITNTGGDGDAKASYIVVGKTASLSNERALVSGFGNTLVDQGANSNVKIDINGSIIPVLSSTQTFAGINTFTAGLSGSLTKLADGTDFLLAGPGITINSSSNGPIEISGSGGGDNDASYIVIGLTASLSNERALTSSFGNQIVDGGANGNVDIKIDETLIPTLTASNTFTGNNIFQAGLSGTLFENESGLELFVAGDLTLIDSSSTTQITISVDRQSLSGNFADVGASYVVLGNTASLPNERALVSGFGNAVVDQGANGDVKIDIDGSIIPVLSATNTFTGANTFSIISGTLMRNQAGASYLVAGDLTLVDSSSGDQVIVSVDRQELSGNFADVGASYVVIGLTASLSNERALSSSFGNKIIDLGADANVEINVDEAEIPVLSASNTFTGNNTFQSGLSGTLFENESGLELFVAGDLTLIDSSSTTQITISVDRQSLSGNFADVGASYVVIGNTASLSNERALTSGFGNTIIDEGADGDVKIDIDGSIIPVLSASNTFTGANVFSIISGTLMKNQAGNSYLVAGDLMLVDSSSGDQVVVSVDRENLSGNFADVGASYVVIGLTASLPNERAVTGSLGIEIIDGGAGSTVDFRISEEEIPILSASNTFTGINIFTCCPHKTPR